MTNALKIRQKFINLMYLVFILFAFIYGPTNSLDSLLYTQRSMKRVNDLLVKEKINLKDSIQFDVAFINANRKEYEAVMSINDSIDNIVNRIDSFRGIIYESNLKLENGFPAHFRSAALANKVFVYSNTGEALRSSLEHLKSSLTSAGFTEFKARLDSLLPATNTVMSSKGVESGWVKFFLAKTPKAILFVTMEKMKSDLLTTSRDIIAGLVKTRNEQAAPEKKVKIKDDNSQLVLTLANGEKVAIPISIASIEDEALRNKAIQEMSKLKINGTVTRDGVKLAEATFNQKPMEPATVVKPDQLFAASVVKYPYDEMYLGIDNPITVDFAAPPGYTRTLEVTEGTVIPKGDKFFLRFDRESFVTVSIYAVKGAEKKLLKDRRLKVVLLPDPEVYLSGYKGGVISKDIVRVANNIEVKYEAGNLGSDVYECQSFDVTLVPIDNPLGEIKVRGNMGTSFSPETKEVLRKAKRGDVIVLDNFKIKTAEGNVRRIATVVYRVI